MAKRPLPWSPERVDVVQKRGTAASLERFPPRTAFKWPRGPPPRCHRPEWCKANKRGQTNRHGEERQVDKKQGKKSRGSGDRGGVPHRVPTAPLAGACARRRQEPRAVTAGGFSRWRGTTRRSQCPPQSPAESRTRRHPHGSRSSPDHRRKQRKIGRAHV